MTILHCHRCPARGLARVLALAPRRHTSSTVGPSPSVTAGARPPRADRRPRRRAPGRSRGARGASERARRRRAPVQPRPPHVSRRSRRSSGDRPQHLAGEARRVSRGVPAQAGERVEKTLLPVQQRSATFASSSTRPRPPPGGRWPADGSARAAVRRHPIARRGARQHADARPLGRDPARTDAGVRRDGAGRRLLGAETTGQGVLAPTSSCTFRVGSTSSSTPRRRSPHIGARGQRGRATRRDRLRCGARAQGARARPSSARRRTGAQFDADTGVHVDVPPGRGVPRGGGGAGCGSSSASRRTRRAHHDAAHDRRAAADDPGGVAERERVGARREPISDVGRELYKRLATMGTHVAKLGRSLDTAVGRIQQDGRARTPGAATGPPLRAARHQGHRADTAHADRATDSRPLGSPSSWEREQAELFRGEAHAA